MGSDVTFSSDNLDEMMWARWPREPDDDAETEIIPPREEVPERPKEDITPKFSSITFNNSELIIKEMIGRGGYGQVNSGFYKNEEVAVKLAKTEGKNGEERGGVKIDGKPNQGPLKREHDIYEILQKDGGGCVLGLPVVHGYASDGGYELMVMQKLDKLPGNANKGMKPEDLANIAIKAIKILKNLHDKGYVHADIKPNNFMHGKNDELFLIDLGLAVKWRNDSDNHVEYDQHPCIFRGTRTFASVHAHLGRTGPENGSRRDDMQSLAYTLLHLHCGRLPWQHRGKTDKDDEKEKEVQRFQICLEKMSYSPRKLSLLWPRESRKYFKKFLDDVMNLKFEEKPHYEDYASWFEIIKERSFSSTSIESGSQAMPSPPLQIFGATPQWISTYNHQRAIKQRYHYNIPQNDNVLSRYLNKKSDEKLFISCACSYEDLLALIKREGNDYTDQVYSILDNLDDRTWMEEKWSQNYCITALAGTNNGKLLVVMAKGTPFSNQLFGNSETFPESFLQQKWKKDGRIITAMTTAGNNWAVVLSQCKGSSQTIEQAVEFDLCYPMEGIYNRWKNRYRVSLAAASKNQIAFVLDRISIDEDATHAQDGRSVNVETQKMLLTEDFPGSRIKGNWSKCFYLSSLCYCPKRSYHAQDDLI